MVVETASRASNLWRPVETASSPDRWTGDDDERDVQRYAELVEKFAGELARPGEPRWDDDDHYREKVEVLVRERPAVASFIIGLIDMAMPRGLGA